MRKKIYTLVILFLLILITGCGDVTTSTDTDSSSSNNNSSNNSSDNGDSFSNTTSSDGTLQIIGKVTYDRVHVNNNGIGLNYNNITQDVAKQVVVKAIGTDGRACRSLLIVPGHVTIYLGQRNGEPIIMHDYWGARLKNGTKHILGRSVITTTKVGKERPDVKEKSMLINTISGLVSF